jgi:UDP-N-acetylenolpyruvoylglucosamine reductase
MNGELLVQLTSKFIKEKSVTLTPIKKTEMITRHILNLRKERMKTQNIKHFSEGTFFSS